VFKLTLDALVKEVEFDRNFGETVAGRPVVESKKRGLHHAHSLIFLKKKITVEDDAQPIYRRRAPASGGYSAVDTRGHAIGNRWVVPYNRYLTLKYGEHTSR